MNRRSKGQRIGIYFCLTGGACGSLAPPFFAVVNYSAYKGRLRAISEIERLKQERKKYERITKIAAVFMFIFAFGLILTLSNNFINSYKIQKRISIDESKTIIHESSETSVIELCVVDKRIEFYGLTGMLNKYVLVLSNDMLVYVKKSEFMKYEKDHFYDFTVTETTRISQWVTTT